MSNVKVAVRVRPFNQREHESRARFIAQREGSTLSIYNVKLDNYHEFGDSRERIKSFTFDYVYWSVDLNSPNYATQEMVFQDLGTDVLQAAFEGYNACVFAYGQTGSGKTHTMMGLSEEPGLIPRICEGLFARMDDVVEQEDDGEEEERVSYRISVSYLEIYNERVRDLLRPSLSKLGEKYTLKVREHPKDGPYVQDLSQHLVKDHKALLALVDKGNETRTTAATHMHESSSRSHAIFTVSFTQAKLDAELPSETVSKINLVDLAGSERADPSTNPEKLRLKEGANINKSLVTLGNVIKALAEKSLLSWGEESLGSTMSVGSGDGSRESVASTSPRRQRHLFIPYRDSVLTWLLKDSLGGNSKTIMIATISPSSLYYSETISTLRYAQRAKRIVNKPTVNEDANVRLIRELRREIDRLRGMLCSHVPCDIASCPTSPIKESKNMEIQAGSLQSLSDTSSYIAERLEENELRATELTKNWFEKWQEAHEIMKESDMSIRSVSRRNSMGVIVDLNLPHLVGMDDDILSTGILMYYLKEGRTTIGTDEAIIEQDIVLQGDDCEAEHCIIKNRRGQVTLYPKPQAVCHVNGYDITEPVKLTQGDVILLGKGCMFRFNNPEEAVKLRERRRSLYGDGRLPGALSRGSSLSSLNNSGSADFESSSATPASPLPVDPVEGFDDQEKTDAELLQQAKEELERLRAEYRLAKEAWYEQEEQLWRSHEAHRTELEEEKSLLADRMEQQKQAREEAERHLQEAKKRLEEMEEHVRLQQEAEGANRLGGSVSSVEFSAQTHPLGHHLGVQTDDVGAGSGSLQGVADVYGAEIYMHKISSFTSFQHTSSSSLPYSPEKQQQIAEMFLASSHKEELEQRRRLEEKEKRYQAEDAEKFDLLAVDQDKLEEMEQKQSQLEKYIDSKEKLLSREEPLGESFSEGSVGSTKSSSSNRGQQTAGKTAKKSSLTSKSSSAPKPVSRNPFVQGQGRGASPEVTGQNRNNTSQGNISASAAAKDRNFLPAKSSPKFKTSSKAEAVTARLYNPAPSKKQPEASDGARKKTSPQSSPSLHNRSHSAPVLSRDQQGRAGSPSGRGRAGSPATRGRVSSPAGRGRARSPGAGVQKPSEGRLSPQRTLQNVNSRLKLSSSSLTSVPEPIDELNEEELMDISGAAGPLSSSLPSSLPEHSTGGFDSNAMEGENDVFQQQAAEASLWSSGPSALRVQAVPIEKEKSCKPLSSSETSVSHADSQPYSALSAQQDTAPTGATIVTVSGQKHKDRDFELQQKPPGLSDDKHRESLDNSQIQVQTEKKVRKNKENQKEGVSPADAKSVSSHISTQGAIKTNESRTNFDVPKTEPSDLMQGSCTKNEIDTKSSSQRKVNTKSKSKDRAESEKSGRKKSDKTKDSKSGKDPKLPDPSLYLKKGAKKSAVKITRTPTSDKDQQDQKQKERKIKVEQKEEGQDATSQKLGHKRSFPKRDSLKDLIQNRAIKRPKEAGIPVEIYVPQGPTESGSKPAGDELGTKDSVSWQSHSTEGSPRRSLPADGRSWRSLSAETSPSHSLPAQPDEVTKMDEGYTLIRRGRRSLEDFHSTGSFRKKIKVLEQCFVTRKLPDGRTQSIEALSEYSEKPVPPVQRSASLGEFVLHGEGGERHLSQSLKKDHASEMYSDDSLEETPELSQANTSGEVMQKEYLQALEAQLAVSDRDYSHDSLDEEADQERDSLNEEPAQEIDLQSSERQVLSPRDSVSENEATPIPYFVTPVPASHIELTASTKSVPAALVISTEEVPPPSVALFSPDSLTECPIEPQSRTEEAAAQGQSYRTTEGPSQSSASKKAQRQRSRRRPQHHQLQHEQSTESDAAGTHSDDSITSGVKSRQSSRPGSASKRRRRQPRSGDNGPKRQRTHSSEEYITSDNDSIYSEDSLVHSDDRIMDVENSSQVTEYTESVNAMTTAIHDDEGGQRFNSDGQVSATLSSSERTCATTSESGVQSVDNIKEYNSEQSVHNSDSKHIEPIHVHCHDPDLPVSDIKVWHTQADPTPDSTVDQAVSVIVHSEVATPHVPNIAPEQASNIQSKTCAKQPCLSEGDVDVWSSPALEGEMDTATQSDDGASVTPVERMHTMDASSYVVCDTQSEVYTMRTDVKNLEETPKSDSDQFSAVQNDQYDTENSSQFNENEILPNSKNVQEIYSRDCGEINKNEAQKADSISLIPNVTEKPSGTKVTFADTKDSELQDGNTRPDTDDLVAKVAGHTEDSVDIHVAHVVSEDPGIYTQKHYGKQVQPKAGDKAGRSIHHSENYVDESLQVSSESQEVIDQGNLQEEKPDRCVKDEKRNRDSGYFSVTTPSGDYTLEPGHSSDSGSQSDYRCNSESESIPALNNTGGSVFESDFIEPQIPTEELVCESGTEMSKERVYQSECNDNMLDQSIMDSSKDTSLDTSKETVISMHMEPERRLLQRQSPVSGDGDCEMVVEPAIVSESDCVSMETVQSVIPVSGEPTGVDEWSAVPVCGDPAMGDSHRTVVPAQAVDLHTAPVISGGSGRIGSSLACSQDQPGRVPEDLPTYKSKCTTSGPLTAVTDNHVSSDHSVTQDHDSLPVKTESAQAGVPSPGDTDSGDAIFGINDESQTSPELTASVAANTQGQQTVTERTSSEAEHVEINGASCAIAVPEVHGDSGHLQSSHSGNIATQPAQVREQPAPVTNVNTVDLYNRECEQSPFSDDNAISVDSPSSDSAQGIANDGADGMTRAASAQSLASDVSGTPGQDEGYGTLCMSGEVLYHDVDVPGSKNKSSTDSSLLTKDQSDTGFSFATVPDSVEDYTYTDVDIEEVLLTDARILQELKQLQGDSASSESHRVPIESTFSDHLEQHSTPPHSPETTPVASPRPSANRPEASQADITVTSSSPPSAGDCEGSLVLSDLYSQPLLSDTVADNMDTKDQVSHQGSDPGIFKLVHFKAPEPKAKRVRKKVKREPEPDKNKLRKSNMVMVQLSHDQLVNVEPDIREQLDHDITTIDTQETPMITASDFCADVIETPTQVTDRLVIYLHEPPDGADTHSFNEISESDPNTEETEHYVKASVHDINPTVDPWTTITGVPQEVEVAKAGHRISVVSVTSVDVNVDDVASMDMDLKHQTLEEDEIIDSGASSKQVEGGSASDVDRMKDFDSADELELQEIPETNEEEDVSQMLPFKNYGTVDSNSQSEPIDGLNSGGTNDKPGIVDSEKVKPPFQRGDSISSMTVNVDDADQNLADQIEVMETISDAEDNLHYISDDKSKTVECPVYENETETPVPGSVPNTIRRDESVGSFTSVTVNVDDTEQVMPDQLDDTELVTGDYPDNTVPAKPGHQDDTVQAIPGHQDDTEPAIPGHQDDTEPAKPGHQDDTEPAKPGHQDDTVQAIPGHQDDTEPAIPGHQDDTEPAKPGHQDDTEPAKPGHQDDSEPAKPGHQDDTEPAKPGHQDDTEPAIPGHQDDTESVIPGHVNNTKLVTCDSQNDTDPVTSGDLEDTKLVTLDHQNTETVTPDHQNDTERVKSDHQDDTKLVPGNHQNTEPVTPDHQNDTELFTHEPLDDTKMVTPDHQDDTGPVRPGHLGDTKLVTCDQQDDTDPVASGDLEDTKMVKDDHQNDTVPVTPDHQNYTEPVTLGHLDDTKPVTHDQQNNTEPVTTDHSDNTVTLDHASDLEPVMHHHVDVTEMVTPDSFHGDSTDVSADSTDVPVDSTDVPADSTDVPADQFDRKAEADEASYQMNKSSVGNNGHFDSAKQDLKGTSIPEQKINLNKDNLAVSNEEEPDLPLHNISEMTKDQHVQGDPHEHVNKDEIDDENVPNEPLGQTNQDHDHVRLPEQINRETHLFTEPVGDKDDKINMLVPLEKKQIKVEPKTGTYKVEPCDRMDIVMQESPQTSGHETLAAAHDEKAQDEEAEPVDPIQDETSEICEELDSSASTLTARDTESQQTDSIQTTEDMQSEPVTIESIRRLSLKRESSVSSFTSMTANAGDDDDRLSLVAAADKCVEDQGSQLGQDLQMSMLDSEILMEEQEYVPRGDPATKETESDDTVQAKPLQDYRIPTTEHESDHTDLPRPTKSEDHEAENGSCKTSSDDDAFATASEGSNNSHVDESEQLTEDFYPDIEDQMGFVTDDSTHGFASDAESVVFVPSKGKEMDSVSGSPKNTVPVITEQRPKSSTDIYEITTGATLEKNQELQDADTHDENCPDSNSFILHPSKSGSLELSSDTSQLTTEHESGPQLTGPELSLEDVLLQMAKERNLLRHGDSVESTSTVTESPEHRPRSKSSPEKTSTDSDLDASALLEDRQQTIQVSKDSSVVEELKSDAHVINTEVSGPKQQLGELCETHSTQPEVLAFTTESDNEQFSKSAQPSVVSKQYEFTKESECSKTGNLTVDVSHQDGQVLQETLRTFLEQHVAKVEKNQSDSAIGSDSTDADSATMSPRASRVFDKASSGLSPDGAVGQDTFTEITAAQGQLHQCMTGQVLPEDGKLLLSVAERPMLKESFKDSGNVYDAQEAEIHVSGGNKIKLPPEPSSESEKVPMTSPDLNAGKKKTGSVSNHNESRIDEEMVQPAPGTSAQGQSVIPEDKDQIEIGSDRQDNAIDGSNNDNMINAAAGWQDGQCQNSRENTVAQTGHADKVKLIDTQIIGFDVPTDAPPRPLSPLLDETNTSQEIVVHSAATYDYSNTLNLADMTTDLQVLGLQPPPGITVTAQRQVTRASTDGELQWHERLSEACLNVEIRPWREDHADEESEALRGPRQYSADAGAQAAAQPGMWRPGPREGYQAEHRKDRYVEKLQIKFITGEEAEVLKDPSSEHMSEAAVTEESFTTGLSICSSQNTSQTEANISTATSGVALTDEESVCVLDTATQDESLGANDTSQEPQNDLSMGDAFVKSSSESVRTVASQCTYPGSITDNEMPEPVTRISVHNIKVSMSESEEELLGSQEAMYKELMPSYEDLLVERSQPLFMHSDHLLEPTDLSDTRSLGSIRSAPAASCIKGTYEDQYSDDTSQATSGMLDGTPEKLDVSVDTADLFGQPLSLDVISSPLRPTHMELPNELSPLSSASTDLSPGEIPARFTMSPEGLVHEDYSLSLEDGAFSLQSPRDAWLRRLRRVQSASELEYAQPYDWDFVKSYSTTCIVGAEIDAPRAMSTDSITFVFLSKDQTFSATDMTGQGQEITRCRRNSEPSYTKGAYQQQRNRYERDDVDVLTWDTKVVSAEQLQTTWPEAGQMGPCSTEVIASGSEVEWPEWAVSEHTLSSSYEGSGSDYVMQESGSPGHNLDALRAILQRERNLILQGEDTREPKTREAAVQTIPMEIMNLLSPDQFRKSLSDRELSAGRSMKKAGKPVFKLDLLQKKNEDTDSTADGSGKDENDHHHVAAVEASVRSRVADSETQTDAVSLPMEDLSMQTEIQDGVCIDTQTDGANGVECGQQTEDSTGTETDSTAMQTDDVDVDVNETQTEAAALVTSGQQTDQLQQFQMSLSTQTDVVQDATENKAALITAGMQTDALSGRGVETQTDSPATSTSFQRTDDLAVKDDKEMLKFRDMQVQTDTCPQVAPEVVKPIDETVRNGNKVTQSTQTALEDLESSSDSKFSSSTGTMFSALSAPDQSEEKSPESVPTDASTQTFVRSSEIATSPIREISNRISGPQQQDSSVQTDNENRIMAHTQTALSQGLDSEGTQTESSGAHTVDAGTNPSPVAEMIQMAVQTSDDDDDTISQAFVSTESSFRDGFTENIHAHSTPMTNKSDSGLSKPVGDILSDEEFDTSPMPPEESIRTRLVFPATASVEDAPRYQMDDPSLHSLKEEHEKLLALMQKSKDDRDKGIAKRKELLQNRGQEVEFEGEVSASPAQSATINTSGFSMATPEESPDKGREDDAQNMDITLTSAAQEKNTDHTLTLLQGNMNIATALDLNSTQDTDVLLEADGLKAEQNNSSVGSVDTSGSISNQVLTDIQIEAAGTDLLAETIKDIHRSLATEVNQCHATDINQGHTTEDQVIKHGTKEESTLREGDHRQPETVQENFTAAQTIALPRDQFLESAAGNAALSVPEAQRAEQSVAMATGSRITIQTDQASSSDSVSSGRAGLEDLINEDRVIPVRFVRDGLLSERLLAVISPEPYARPPSRNMGTQYEEGADTPDNNTAAPEDRDRNTGTDILSAEVKTGAKGSSVEALPIVDSSNRNMEAYVHTDMASSTSTTATKDEAIETDLSPDHMDELERLRRERQRIADMLSKDVVPSKLQVEMAEAQLNYIIGQTDTLLDALDQPWDRDTSEILLELSAPEQQLSNISKEYLSRYRATLELSQKYIEQRIVELEKERDRERERSNRSRAKSRELAKLRREAALEAFRIEREREQVQYEMKRKMPRTHSYSPAPSSRNVSPDDEKTDGPPNAPLFATYLTPQQRKSYLVRKRKGILKNKQAEERRSKSEERRTRSASPAAGSIASSARSVSPSLSYSQSGGRSTVNQSVAEGGYRPGYTLYATSADSLSSSSGSQRYRDSIGAASYHYSEGLYPRDLYGAAPYEPYHQRGQFGTATYPPPGGAYQHRDKYGAAPNQSETLVQRSSEHETISTIRSLDDETARLLNEYQAARGRAESEIARARDTLQSRYQQSQQYGSYLQGSRSSQQTARLAELEAIKQRYGLTGQPDAVMEKPWTMDQTGSQPQAIDIEIERMRRKYGLPPSEASSAAARAVVSSGPSYGAARLPISDGGSTYSDYSRQGYGTTASRYLPPRRRGSSTSSSHSGASSYQTYSSYAQDVLARSRQTIEAVARGDLYNTQMAADSAYMLNPVRSLDIGVTASANNSYGDMSRLDGSYLDDYDYSRPISASAIRSRVEKDRNNRPVNIQF